MGERKARVPPPPSSPLRGLATLLPSLGVETGARAPFAMDTLSL